MTLRATAVTGSAMGALDVDHGSDVSDRHLLELLVLNLERKGSGVGTSRLLHQDFRYWQPI
jgi:hypothetical protein